jgi:hypothetical protein
MQADSIFRRGYAEKALKLPTELGEAVVEIGKKYIDSSIDKQFVTEYLPRREDKGGDK